ncbi:MAG: hypothetical protein RR640_00865 [Oscillospiraceae bacterium]
MNENEKNSDDILNEILNYADNIKSSNLNHLEDFPFKEKINEIKYNK